jgi:hypothetical protein
MLENRSEFEILLIQEPWFNMVATLCSDTNPVGVTQLGIAMHPEWDAHLPKHKNGQICKAVAYTKKSLGCSHIVENILNHPLANPNSIILNVKEDGEVLARLMNTYYAVPPNGHNLQYLLDHDPNDQVPTIITGDLNTHSRLWSIEGRTPSPWAATLEDWLECNDFLLLNPDRTPTWDSGRDDTQPLVIDVVLANLVARFSNQIGEVSISWSESLASDHAALLFTLYPSDSLALIPAPAPNGYKAEPENRESWVEAFAMSLPPCLPYAPPHSTEPEDPSVICHRVPAHDHLNLLVKAFDHAIDTACKTTLKPKWAPDPQGASWWTDECTHAHIIARNAQDGPERQEATCALKQALAKAKREWAHQMLHEAEHSGDIWRMSKVWKGCNTNIFPAMKDTSGNLVTDNAGKATLFCQRFFPTTTCLVNTIQHDDPPPLDMRQWADVVLEEITEALRTTSNTSAADPSGVGYTILKWAHAACPDALTVIFNLCLTLGVHPWNTVTIVVLNKPQKLDYSQPKAYRPISLLECTGKVLEKIVANQINADILKYDILPPTQFGSRPHHNAVDAIATLVHRI